MKKNLLLGVAVFLLSHCQPKFISQTTSGNLPEAFKINLNQTVTLNGNLGDITFSHLDDSRCPANAVCVRQGAAIASFTIQTKNTEKQTVRLFIGDFMPNDPRNKRSQTADTLAIQLRNNSYQLILQEIMPYPGTTTEIPKATIIIKKP
ncbi:hypothetical protein AAE02nite_50830 [Adhaeribacter aerolatus]|uniref:Uncharacterized protein n=1 Tax=Adhaeribacter aerolatus TaxID=670289 RepID=A0A512B630_9BACT|nr:hypothetical protein [Adhaeribacter aerolatus]GEO07419.1 hypothetical protein AAE02nite_50830 [Adhaeribacter aerolatus]